MTRYHKELKTMAGYINKFENLIYQVRVNRRNGYYAIDLYHPNDTMYDCLFYGNFKECRAFLDGMQKACWYNKPF